MHYIHEPYQPGETIAAVATPLGEGGVSIIRISGNHAVEVADKVFTGPVKTFKSHTAHYGYVIDKKGNKVDSALVLPMLSPHSYTGDDTVEIHCHGGSLITRKVLDVVLQAGARQARPGEFTLKAFMNGKLDLAQAEAVQELICAKNERALDAAENQLIGRLSEKIRRFQSSITDIAAILEAWVDFPEEGLEFASKEEVVNRLESTIHEMQTLYRTYHDGKIAHDGIALCLIGSPNVGKSSLMNALLNRERAIVSDIPGTTRDILEDQLRLNDLNYRLIDTAGIRETQEMIEQEGIKRSHHAMSEADLILLILDAHKGLDQDDRRLLDVIPQDKTIVIWNKIDLPHDALPTVEMPHVVSISAKYKQHLETLHHEIDRVIWRNGPPSREEVLITNVRHKEALGHAIQGLSEVIEGLKQGTSPEFVSFEMRQSLAELGKIIGLDVTEGILTSIFSQFCVGK